MNVSTSGPALSLADLLKAYRSDARLSQEELARRAGVSARTVGDIECGVAKSPRAMTLSLLAEALELGPEDHARLRASILRPTAVANAERRSVLPHVTLLGRAEDVSAASSLLRAQTLRLLTFVGPPGVGKTSLALRVAAELESAFAGGAVLVELAALADAALVPTKIAVALGVRDVRGEPLIQTLLRRLNERPMLLVLDTLEHLLAAASFVDELLTGAPRLVVVATSRVPLRIPGENAFAVSPFPIPTRERAYTLEELATLPTVQLFIERARLTKRDFALTNENAAAVAELCRALDGIPLAVELAAPRLKIFSPAALAARLQRRLLLLEGDQLDRPARHRTMRAALAWSYELLSPGEQSVLRRIAVFRSHFSARGARAVTLDAHGGERVHVLPVLAVLVDHNLLRVDDTGAEPYFELPQLIRAYAYDQLVATEGLDMVSLQLARYCLETAALARLAQAPAERRPIMDRLERESATFDAVLDWALDSGRIELGLRLTYALRVFWYLRGSCTEGLRWSSAFLAAAQREAGGLPADVLANAYRQMMSLAVTAGDLDGAERAATRAVEFTARTGDQKAIAFISNLAGFIASQRGDYARARALIEDGLRLRRDVGDAHDIGNSLRDLGRSLADSGDAEAGVAFLEESLLFYERVEAALGAGEALQNLGVIAARRGDDERAERLTREALAFGAAHGHAMLVTSATVLLGHLALRRGAHPEAARFFGQALASLERASFADIPEVLDGLATCACASQRSRDAARLLGGAASLRARMKKQIVPADRAAYETLVAAVTNALSPPVFDAEWTIGGTLSYEELRSIAHTLIDEVTRI